MSMPMIRGVATHGEATSPVVRETSSISANHSHKAWKQERRTTDPCAAPNDDQ